MHYLESNEIAIWHDLERPVLKIYSYQQWALL